MWQSLTTSKQNLSFPPTNDAPSPESVQLLRRKAAASQNVTAKLLAETARNDAIIAQMQALTAPKAQEEDSAAEAQSLNQPNFSFLNSSPSSRALGISTDQSPNHVLTTNTTFTLSQLPALKAILADLRPRLTGLQSIGDQDGARNERRQERRDYIEQRTRSHLDQHGAVHADNAHAFNGRRIDQDEVDAMEKVASIFAEQ